MDIFVFYSVVVLLFLFLLIGYNARHKAGISEGELRTFKTEHEDSRLAIRSLYESINSVSSDVCAISDRIFNNNKVDDSDD